MIQRFRGSGILCLIPSRPIKPLTILHSCSSPRKMMWSRGNKKPRLWELKQQQPYSFGHTLITPNLHMLISSASGDQSILKAQVSIQSSQTAGNSPLGRGTKEPRWASKPKGNDNKKAMAVVKMSCVSFPHERNYLNWHKINLRNIFLELHRKIPHTFWQQLNISLMEFIWGLE